MPVNRDSPARAGLGFRCQPEDDRIVTLLPVRRIGPAAGPGPAGRGAYATRTGPASQCSLQVDFKLAAVTRDWQTVTVTPSGTPSGILTP